MKRKIVSLILCAVIILGAASGCDGQLTVDNEQLTITEPENEPEIIAEETETTEEISMNLRGFSEIGYNVIVYEPIPDSTWVTIFKSPEEIANILVWDFDYNADTYTVFRDSEELAVVSGENFYFDRDVEVNQSYTYHVIQILNGESKESNPISVTALPNEPEGDSAWEHMNIVKTDKSRMSLNIESAFFLYIIYQQGDSSRHVSKDLILATEGRNGSTISWHSDNEQLINSQGIVSRILGSSFFPVTLTAVFQSGEFMTRKTFDVSVAPLSNAVQQEPMTMELLSELNPNIMPTITYNDDGTILRIDDTGTLKSPENIISPFPVFSADDAQILIESYLGLFGLDDDTDIRFHEFWTISTTSITTTNTFRFKRYYNDVMIYSVYSAGDIWVITNNTGHVTGIRSSPLLNLDINTTPAISSEEAKQIILSALDISEWMEHWGEPKLFIWHEVSISELSWGVLNGSFPGIVISAFTGEVIMVEENPR
jgi:hypothetical protein